MLLAISSLCSLRVSNSSYQRSRPTSEGWILPHTSSVYLQRRNTVSLVPKREVNGINLPTRRGVWNSQYSQVCGFISSKGGKSRLLFFFSELLKVTRSGTLTINSFHSVKRKFTLSIMYSWLTSRMIWIERSGRNSDDAICT